MLKPEQPVQQQPMAPMPFYADPTRFTTPVWQAEPAQTWPQGQFIQQIPATAQPTLEGYPPQQYPNGIYPTAYQQPATFETGTFYTGVQVLTNTRPPSAPNHAQLTPRANGSYSHTPSPVSSQPQSQPAQQRSNISGQYHQEYVNSQGYVAPSTPTGGSVDNSRPSSVNSVVNVPTSNQNFQQQTGGNFTSVSSTNFSPGSNANPNFVNAGSGNEKPGYPQVNSSPQLVSHSSSGYSGNEYGGNMQQQTEQTQHWPVVNSENMMWDPNIGQDGSKSNLGHDDGQYSKPHESGSLHDHNHQCDDQFSQSSRVNLNSRIKSMILNKQQNIERKLDEEQCDGDNKTGHFLWYSHHRRPPDLIGGGGGVPSPTSDFKNQLDKSRHLYAKNEHVHLQQLLPQENFLPNKTKTKQDIKHGSPNLMNGAFKAKKQQENNEHHKYNRNQSAKAKLHGEKNSPQNYFVGSDRFERYDIKATENEDKIKNNGTDIPQCNCFPADKIPPEPGSYYTHLGCSSSLANLRKDLETRTGVQGKAIRIEKVCYTGKEGKTAQGCPLAKWIIRRSHYDEKYLVIVKHRQGHVCFSAYLVICIVAWEGVDQLDADNLYTTLTDKLNSFGVATSRRCATNEQRTCACQGLDPKTCGASFSFGCSWSMYYNGCKFARSKIVRKFRLTERSEEENLESRLQNLATHIMPLYKTLAPDSFKNQCEHEDEAGDCRLGLADGKPFSGVTACMDFCAHAHKDSHNMNNGCTVVVSLTKERSLSKPDDEQLHVLPLYTIDSTDEFGSKENQNEKVNNGSVEILNRYECEVRIRTVPLQPCRRRKKKDEDCTKESPVKRENISSRSSTSSGYDSSRSQTPKTPSKNIDTILQSSHISSTVLDSPKSWTYDSYGVSPVYYNQYDDWSQPKNSNPDSTMYHSINSSVLPQDKVNTAFKLTYPKHEPQNKFESPLAQNILLQNKVQDSYSGIRISNQSLSNQYNANGVDYNVNNFNSDIGTPLRSGPYNFHFNNDKSTPAHLRESPFKIPHTPESPSRIPSKSLYIDELSRSDRFYRNDFQPHSNPISNAYLASLDSRETNTCLPSFDDGFHKNHFKAMYQNSPERLKDAFFVAQPKNHDLVQRDVWRNQTITETSRIIQESIIDHGQKLVPGSPDNWRSLPSPSEAFKRDLNLGYQLCNPFDDSIGDCGLKRSDFSPNYPNPDYGYFSPTWSSPKSNCDFSPITVSQPEQSEALGKVTDVVDNLEAFRDSQIGGVAIALGHGSVLFECAKHELHATTALKKPNRTSPTRISLVFYQHRNLNRAKHGWDQWEEKNRLKKLGLSDVQNLNLKVKVSLGHEKIEVPDFKALVAENNAEILLRAPTLTTMSITTLFPMYPCMVTGPYQETQSFG